MHRVDIAGDAEQTLNIKVIPAVIQPHVVPAAFHRRAVECYRRMAGRGAHAAGVDDAVVPDAQLLALGLDVFIYVIDEAGERIIRCRAGSVLLSANVFNLL